VGKKPRTQRQVNQATDARLQKTYNITLADRTYLESLHDGKCWISGRPAGTRSLHVDHDHSYKKVKIQAERWTPEKNDADTWCVSAVYNGVEYFEINPKKSIAVRDLKKQLLRASVRGLLSYNINAGLQKFSDSPELLRAAADYLENFRKGSPLTGRGETT
jgi:hypothetical protein